MGPGRLVALRRDFDLPFGELAELARTSGIHRSLGFSTFEDYCRERLLTAPRTVRERIWLHRRMCALPEIREALASGRLTFTKALVVAKGATEEDVEARIEEAVGTTWQQVERGSTDAEDRRDRAAGVLRIWGPKEAMETVAAAICSSLALAASRGEPIGAGEALARVGDHFKGVWSARWKRPKASRCRRAMLPRTGGVCAVPGCTGAAEHAHHLEFLSQGGEKVTENEAPGCARHHIRGIHGGFLRVTGRAGERLVWRFGAASDGEPLEVWETRGDDDVRRVG